MPSPTKDQKCENLLHNLTDFQEPSKLAQNYTPSERLLNQDIMIISIFVEENRS